MVAATICQGLDLNILRVSVEHNLCANLQYVDYLLREEHARRYRDFMNDGNDRKYTLHDRADARQYYNVLETIWIRMHGWEPARRGVADQSSQQQNYPVTDSIGSEYVPVSDIVIKAHLEDGKYHEYDAEN